jgi:hypothetical protein
LQPVRVSKDTNNKKYKNFIEINFGTDKLQFFRIFFILINKTQSVLRNPLQRGFAQISVAICLSLTTLGQTDSCPPGLAMTWALNAFILLSAGRKAGAAARLVMLASKCCSALLCILSLAFWLAFISLVNYLLGYRIFDKTPFVISQSLLSEFVYLNGNSGFFGEKVDSFCVNAVCRDTNGDCLIGKNLLHYKKRLNLYVKELCSTIKNQYNFKTRIKYRLKSIKGFVGLIRAAILILSKIYCKQIF